MGNETLHNNRLKELREKIGITRNQLHQITGLSNNALRTWEICQALPNGKSLIILSKYYGVSVDYILCLTDNPEINR